MLIETSDSDFADLISLRGSGKLRLPTGQIERTETLVMLRELAAQIRVGFRPASWMIVSDDQVVGLCSLVKPPYDGVIEIGYGVAKSHRRRGFATAAVGDLVKWAYDDARVHIVRAESSITNIPSQLVLERNGFSRVGWRVDHEDGELISWEIVVSSDHVSHHSEPVSYTKRLAK